jgi:cation diffusion facilitator family transporter
MSDDCCKVHTNGLNDARWRRVLWIALAVNATMFAAEAGAGMLAHSQALQADALDFLGDAFNYAISLMVVGMALLWRARAALVKGIAMVLFGLYVVGSTVWALTHGGLPHAETMSMVAAIALVANLGVAILLYRYRTGDANMRSVWLCTRNDCIGNLAVQLAALSVYKTGAQWPDLLVAAVMASLALWSGAQIIRDSRRELFDEALLLPEKSR